MNFGVGRLTARQTALAGKLHARHQRGCGYIGWGDHAIVFTLPKWAERRDVDDYIQPVGLGKLNFPGPSS